MFLSQFLSFPFFLQKKSGRPLPIEIWQDLSDYYDTEVPTTDDECSEIEPEAVHIETVCIELNRPPKGILAHPFLFISFISVISVISDICDISLNTFISLIIFSNPYLHDINSQSHVLLHLFRTLPMTYQKLHLTTPKAGSVTQHCHARLELLPNRMREHSIRTISR